MNSSDMPGIYRQTTETTGMYSPLKKHLYRAQHIIIPSKNCASQRVIPSHAPLLPPYDYPTRKPVANPPLEMFKISRSLPQLKGLSGGRTVSPDGSYSPSLRPYTPPEKRYSANFGTRPPPLYEKKTRPRSCIYENVHFQDEICNNRVKSDRALNNYAQKVKHFPTPEFSQMYIQESLE